MSTNWINPYISKIANFPDIIIPFDQLDKNTLCKIIDSPKVWVDLGAGSGNFLVNQADHLQQNSDLWSFVGVETRYKRLYLAASKTSERNLKKITWLQQKIEKLLELLDSQSIDVFTCNYPDPWPKKRHRKNRSINETRLGIIYEKLKQGGSFYFRTDQLDYFQEVTELVEGSEFTLEIWTENYIQSDFYQKYWETEFEQVFKKTCSIGFLKATKSGLPTEAGSRPQS